MRLIAVFLLTGVLGSPSAIADDRSDVMLRAFQDACFPRLDDPAARRQKIVGAGFAPVSVDAVPEIQLMAELPNALRKFVGIPEGYQGRLPSVEYATYQGRREGFDLVVAHQVMVSRQSVKRSQCIVYDFGASEAVSEKKVAEWIGRPADRQIRLRLRDRGRVWASGTPELPGGYRGVVSAYVSATRGIPWSAAYLGAEASPSRESPAK